MMLSVSCDIIHFKVTLDYFCHICSIFNMLGFFFTFFPQTSYFCLVLSSYQKTVHLYLPLIQIPARNFVLVKISSVGRKGRKENTSVFFLCCLILNCLLNRNIFLVHFVEIKKQTNKQELSRTCHGKTSFIFIFFNHKKAYISNKFEPFPCFGKA